MVKLPPQQQALFVRSHPDVFTPVKGGWGARGATSIKLRAAKSEALRRALQVAWKNVAPASLVAQQPVERAK